MRFATFDFTPPDVKVFTACGSDGCNQKAKKEKRAKKAVQPNEKQMVLIKSVAKLVDPAIWLDQNIFPSNPSVLKALALLTESAGQNVTSRFLRGNYVAAMESYTTMRLYRGSVVIFSGTIGEVYKFALKFAPDALPAIKESCCKALYTSSCTTQDLASMLTNFRNERNWAKSLEKLTKVCQLPMIDQDATPNKFRLTSDDCLGTFCVHYGSGCDNGNSVLALSAYNDKDGVVCVDPRIRHQGPSSHAAVYDASKHTYGDTVSDVAFGDENGMVVGAMHSYVMQLYKGVKFGVVICKIVLVKGYGEVRGFVRNKPRPHNLELIVELHEDGDLLDDICDEYVESVIKANQLRNKWVYQQKIPIAKLDTFNSPDELKCLFLVEKPDERYVKAPTFRRLDRNVVLLTIKKDIGPVLWDKFRKRCRNTRLPCDRYAVLPCYYEIQPGRLSNCSMVFPDVEMMFATLVKTAESRGLQVYYSSGEWVCAKCY